MPKLKILVDLDDTVWDLCSAWINCLNKRFNRNVKLSDVTEWDITKVYPGLSKNEIYSPLYEENLWKSIKIRKDALEILPKLIDDGHEIFFVTATDYRNIKFKIDLIKQHFPYVPISNLIITYRKDMVKGDLLIDDGPHNFNGHFGFLMSANHNLNEDVSKLGIVRVNDWYELYKILK